MTIEEHRAALEAWRKLSNEEQAKIMEERARANDKPGLLTKAANFVVSAHEHYVKDDGRKASPGVVAERERICRSNACGKSVNDARGCEACGCGIDPAFVFVGLDMFKKRTWASARCPLDPPLWDKV